MYTDVIPARFWREFSITINLAARQKHSGTLAPTACSAV
jgi:hypothetical protein